ncbi:MAG TPA: nucleotidyltransferase domain-containing protein [Candidatus Nanoarchaeia archaeon]|nr:nucleotidyltransferase domain-containing protein [Candidatus Nanoarchaeia archaeon]
MHEFTFFKVARFFLDNPYQEVYLRELAKKLKISPFAVKGYADLLVREGLILEERKANLRLFKGNIGNPVFRHLKISLNVDALLKSGLIDFLKENIPNISSIVLFGSLAKGENDSKSDVDILVIGKESRKSSGKFGERLNREINIHFFSWSEWNQKAKQDSPFYFEVIAHGIPLFGELPVVKWK